MTQIVDCDVLVVGGGGIAARAAVEAERAGARVALAVKGRFGAVGIRGCGGTAGGISAGGGFRAPAPEAREDFYQDIVQLGLGLADRKLARILVDEGAAARAELEDWGAVFVHTSGFKCHGMPIMLTLESKIRRSSIALHEETMVTDLLLQEGRCSGALGLRESGEPVVFRAGATVLGTGGAGQMCRFNMSPSCVTGDGHAMGYRAGAELRNMEFIQIIMASVYPTLNVAMPTFFQAPPRIYNGLGKEFIQDYLPAGATAAEAIQQHGWHNPTTTRDTLSRYVDIAMVEEVKAGRANQHGAIYFDMTGDRPVISAGIRDWFLYRGIDISREPVEMAVCYHCQNGGLTIDENAQTTIPGLYAGGETAAGPYGADRRGGTMLAFTQVFGKRAGRHAAQAARQMGLGAVAPQVVAEHEQRIAELGKKRGKRKPADLLGILQQTTFADLLVTRSKQSLGQGLQKVQELRAELSGGAQVENAADLVQALELENMLTVAEMVARAALERTESRGAHCRLDYPARDDHNWMKVITLRNDGGQMALGTQVVDTQWKDRPGDMGTRIWG